MDRQAKGHFGDWRSVYYIYSKRGTTLEDRSASQSCGHSILASVAASRSAAEKYPWNVV